MTLPAGKVCYYRPARKNPRKYTAKDVARIARYAVLGGSDAILVVKEVIKALGLGSKFCKLAMMAAIWIKIRRYLMHAGAAWGVKKFLELLLRLIGYLKSPFLAWTVRLNIAAALVIAAVTYLDKLFKTIQDAVDRVPDVADVAELAGDLCQEAADYLVDVVGD